MRCLYQHSCNVRNLTALGIPGCIHGYKAYHDRGSTERYCHLQAANNQDAYFDVRYLDI